MTRNIDRTILLNAISYLVSSAVVSLLIYYNAINAAAGFIGGLVITLFATVLIFAFKKKTQIIIAGVVLNSISCGFSLGAFLAYENNFYLTQYLSSLLIAIVFVIVCFYAKFKRDFIKFAFMIQIFMIAVFGFEGFYIGNVIFRYLFFHFVISAIFVYGLILAEKINNKYTLICWCGYGVYAFITVFVLAIITDGDFIASLDLNIGGESKKRK